MVNKRYQQRRPVYLHSASLVFAIALNTVGDSSRRDNVEKAYRWLVIKLDGGENALADMK